MKRQFQAFNYKVVNQSEDTLDVYIDGIIVDAETQQILKDWFGDDTSVSYKSFRDQVVNAKPKTINVYINSGGGMVTDAMAIHDFLIDQQNKGVRVNRVGRGIVASAATYLLVGDNSSMSENSWFMIHNVSGGAYGDVNMMENYAKSMRKFNDSIVTFYAKATGLSETVIGNMMDKETWMTAEEAKEKGFIKNIDGKADFTNTIKPEHWPFENTAVLNAYNSAVKVPSAKEEGDHKSFFTTLQNGFMKLIDSLTTATDNGKKDKQFENIENRDAILDMVNKVLNPVLKNIDEELAKLKNETEEKPAEEKKEEATTTEAKSEEKKDEKSAEEKKKEEEKKEEAKEEDEEVKNLKAELANMKNEMKNLRDSMASKATKPENTKGESTSKGFNKAKVEYAD
jgi:ATP-dependent Clp endopeptidase proteolytic subunit ClpP